MLANLFLITRNPEMIVRCKIVEGDGGREPERTGGGIGQEAGEQEREAGAEIKKTIICDLSLGIIQSKTQSSITSGEFGNPFNSITS